MSVRYRSGISARDGRPLRGYAHLAQSVDTIISTMKTEIVMLLDFGLDPTRKLGRNVSPVMAAELYRDIVEAVHAYEPEYRIRRLELLELTRGGGLTLALGGVYYPEGRFGNYAIEEPADFNVAVWAIEQRGAA